MPDMYDALKIGISDLIHKSCGTPLTMRYTDFNMETIKPFCPKCKRFMRGHNVIEVNPRLETQRKVIIIIETMSRVDFRVNIDRGKLLGH